MADRRSLTGTFFTGLLVAAAVLLPVRPVTAAVGPGDLPFGSATTVGLHNTYDPAAFGFLAQGLDTGTGMIELDAWTDTVTKEWKVSHSNPLGNANNCVSASTPAQLYTGGGDKNLETCLDDVRVWLGAHPGAGPLVIKLELKAGFAGNRGMGPAHLDSLIAAHLGAAVLRPADVLAKPGGGSYATADEAVRAGNWPTRAALAGRVLVYVIPGSFEEGNPFDTLPTDIEYARHLRDLAAAGRTGEARIFPAVHGAASGDPRTKYAETSIRPWFVVFDGDAAAYAGGIDTSWYDARHYLLTMTDAHKVAPAISATDPTADQARTRTEQLARAHASIVSGDWRRLPAVQSLVLTRG
ncbi:phosphatidylinositol-specific phospholipase C domain-containing protein [Kitasatospora sp. NPDC058201]|uniref:phosphatidylinositol-specific phospholipase C domain-containing protein n=1 Tax=Streptomycetaceae TaxID=2062 RepID=UPI002E79EB45|nr:phosphatidylinositol-specific phospholipase C domain-containing protein [Streptomyces sp. BE303]MED7951488.1 phosphatidylinositol-specific phospholipase C domain-containing protein [Streptomyces sp. BE303]